MPTSLSSAARVPSHDCSAPPYRGVELVTRDGRSLPLVSARLHAEAEGGIARVVLEQRFENSYDETLHVTYRMPLPAEGAVSGYAFELGGRTIVGRVERKQEARAQFEQAIADGKTAALLEQERSDIFTQSVGNLPPRDGLTAKITVDLKLTWLIEGEWELRFPTVIGPRYVGSADSAADVAATAVSVVADGVPARLRLSMQIRDELTGTISSPSHGLRASRDGSVELRDVGGAALDRDLVVRWPVAQPHVGASLEVARPAGQDDMYGLLTIVPPAPSARLRPVPRDLIVLLDTSGSMGGGPLEKAQRVLAHIIESLGERDRLELIEFSSQPSRYKPEPVPATADEKRAAVAWLHSRRAGGGTEMRSAVIAAMAALRPGAQRQVILATDGYIGGEEQVVAQLQRMLPKSCRLHFLGVGSAVNRSLSTAMARAGRGAEVLCGLEEDAERAVKRLNDRLRAPVLTNIELSGTAIAWRAASVLPDVFEGAPYVAAVKVQAGELHVRGETADGPWEHRMRIGACRPGEGLQSIVQLFGRELVAELEMRTVAGERVDAEIEAAGLTYQISTRMTSWVAIDSVVRKVVRNGGETRHEDMPQAIPYGTSAESFGLRKAQPMTTAAMGMGMVMAKTVMAGAPAPRGLSRGGTGGPFGAGGPSQPMGPPPAPSGAPPAPGSQPPALKGEWKTRVASMSAPRSRAPSAQGPSQPERDETTADQMLSLPQQARKSPAAEPAREEGERTAGARPATGEAKRTTGALPTSSEAEKTAGAIPTLGEALPAELSRPAAIHKAPLRSKRLLIMLLVLMLLAAIGWLVL